MRAEVLFLREHMGIFSDSYMLHRSEKHLRKYRLNGTGNKSASKNSKDTDMSIPISMGHEAFSIQGFSPVSPVRILKPERELYDTLGSASPSPIG